MNPGVAPDSSCFSTNRLPVTLAVVGSEQFVLVWHSVVEDALQPSPLPQSPRAPHNHRPVPDIHSTERCKRTALIWF